MFEVALSFAIHTVFFAGIAIYTVRGIIELIRDR